MPVKANWENGEQFSATDANTLADAVNAAYVKPSTGVPITDLTASVQVSLGKADTAVQSVSAASISDATATGRAVLTAADAAAARATLGVSYGSSAGTVVQGNDSRLTPSSTSITDSTATGRSLLTATDVAAARTTLGVAYGSTGGTVAQGNDSRITGAEQTSAKGVADGYASLDSGGRVPAAQIPTVLSPTTVELGHASDTTLSRSAAGVLAVEGIDVATATNVLTLENKTIKGYTESVVARGVVGASSTLSIAAGTVVTATLTASTACTFTMPAVGAGKSFTLMLKQAATTGNGTATFTNVKWPTSGAPTVTAAAGKMDIFSFFSDGTNWYGSYTQGYTP